MSLAAPLLLHYNVDCLAPCGSSGQLVAGLSNFIGPCWTGGIALLSAAGEGPAQLQTLVELRAGVPALACLHRVDEFTGRRVLAIGSDDGCVELWYVSGEALELSQAKMLHSGAVAGLAAAPGASQLASASADGTLRVWDCGQLLTSTAQLGSGGAAQHAVAWTADASTLASVGDAGSLCLWDTRQLGSAPVAVAAVGAKALSLAAAPAGGKQLLVVGDLLGRVSVFDARSLGKPLQQRQLHADAVHALAAAGSGGGSGSLLASGADDGAIMLLDCADLAASRQLAPPRPEGQVPCYIRALAWQSPDGSSRQQLYRGGWDQIVAPVPL